MIRLPSISIPRAALGPTLLVSLLILLMFWHTPPPRPIIAPPHAVTGLHPFARPNPDATLLSPVPIVGQFIQGDRLDVISADGLFNAEDHARLAAELEQALAYTVGRFGHEPAGRINAYVGLEAGCGLHGIAYTNRRMVQVFTCADLPRNRVVTIMAHEFVHQLAHDYYGSHHLTADMILLEGIATWGAGKYWLGNYSDFAAFVRQYPPEQRLPLATSYAGRPISDMNLLYYQWASFVEFLLLTYGRERFDALYITGQHSPGSADYAGVSGQRLETLEQEWQHWLDTL